MQNILVVSVRVREVSECIKHKNIYQLLNSMKIIHVYNRRNIMNSIDNVHTLQEIFSL